MMRDRRFRVGGFAVITAILALLASCDSGPKAGDVTASLATSQQELGSVMFTVTAVAPKTIQGLTAACTG